MFGNILVKSCSCSSVSRAGSTGLGECWGWGWDPAGIGPPAPSVRRGWRERIWKKHTEVILIPRKNVLLCQVVNYHWGWPKVTKKPTGSRQEKSLGNIALPDESCLPYPVLLALTAATIRQRQLHDERLLPEWCKSRWRSWHPQKRCTRRKSLDLEEKQNVLQ